jgi:hypothetical protein
VCDSPIASLVRSNWGVARIKRKKINKAKQSIDVFFAIGYLSQPEVSFSEGERLLLIKGY